MDRLLATKSEGVGLVVLVISFQDFQPMWSQSTNVTDRRTDGRHAIPRPRICTKVHCAVKMCKKPIQQICCQLKARLAFRRLLSVWCHHTDKRRRNANLVWIAICVHVVLFCSICLSATLSVFPFTVILGIMNMVLHSAPGGIHHSHPHYKQSYL